MFAYTVKCTISDPGVAEKWVEWIRGGHAQDVIDAGAQSATLVELDGTEDGVRAFEARYIFKDREAFEAYRRDHGPRLQKEGLATFPLELGLRYERSMGDVLFSC